VGATETQMFNSGEFYWGQTRPAVIPSAVCVKNGNARDVLGNLVPLYLPQAVTDEVTITQASYDPNARTLTVAATSSNTVVPPALQMMYPTFIGDLVGGQIVVPNLLVPPPKVVVASSAAGVNDYEVTTVMLGAAAPGSPVGTADSFTFAEDSGSHILTILANDLNVAGGTVTLSSLPSIGRAVVNPDGTVTYTSNLNANGVDSFTYTVTVGTQVSTPATVSLSITPVNDPPIAVNDTASVAVNTPLAINVLANDTDPDGVADLANAVLVTGPAAGATVTGGAGGIFNFSATAQGTYTFTYKAQDKALTLSANTGTVTVTVLPPFNVVINKNQYTTSQQALLVEGTTTDPGTPTVTVQFLNAAGTPIGLAGTVVAGAGKFRLNTTVALPPGATAIRASLSSGAVFNTALIFK
jgi:hypothetical protein